MYNVYMYISARCILNTAYEMIILYSGTFCDAGSSSCQICESGSTFSNVSGICHLLLLTNKINDNHAVILCNLHEIDFGVGATSDAVCNGSKSSPSASCLLDSVQVCSMRVLTNPAAELKISFNGIVSVKSIVVYGGNAAQVTLAAIVCARNIVTQLHRLQIRIISVRYPVSRLK